METSGDNASPSRRERKPLPDCLVRLLHTHRLDAPYDAGRPVSSGPKTYLRVLAATWVDLDRLAQLTDLIARPKRSA